MTESTKLYSLGYDKAKTYGLVTLFVVGSIALPQLCHLIPNGGAMLLPIYFFTLIAAYKYGLVAGVLTGVLAPIVNYSLFGMPAASVLPVMLVQSLVLAYTASAAARFIGKVSLLGITMAVMAYQFVGCLLSFAMSGEPMSAIGGMLVGLPGMLLQVFGGYAVMKYILKK